MHLGSRRRRIKKTTKTTKTKGRINIDFGWSTVADTFVPLLAVVFPPLGNILTTHNSQTHSNSHSYFHHSEHISCQSLLHAFINLLVSSFRHILQETSMVASSLLQWIGLTRKQGQQQRRRSSYRRCFEGVEEPVLSTIDEDKQILVFEDEYDLDHNRKSSEANHLVLVTLLVVLSMALAARIGTLTGTTLPKHSHGHVHRNIEDNNHDINSIGINSNGTRMRRLQIKTPATATAPKQSSLFFADAQLIRSSSNRNNRAGSLTGNEFVQRFGEEVESATASAPVEDEDAEPSRTKTLPLTKNQPARQYPHGFGELADALMAGFRSPPKKKKGGLRQTTESQRRWVREL